MVYHVDIIDQCGPLGDHVGHLRAVFSKFREHHFFVKRKKCSFVQIEVTFLGYIIKNGTIRMDESKIKVILDWETPTNVKELKSFLGLLSLVYKGAFDVSAPLIEMLKKNQGWA